jgi:predicted esterase
MLQKAEETSQTNESDKVDHSRGMDGDDANRRPPDQGTSRLERSVDWLKNELGITKNPMYPTVPFQKIPLFLGHGFNDGVVRCELGRLASRCLIDLGIETRWNEYNGLEHALSGNMLRDIVLFLDALEGW